MLFEIRHFMESKNFLPKKDRSAHSMSNISLKTNNLADTIVVRTMVILELLRAQLHSMKSLKRGK